MAMKKLKRGQFSDGTYRNEFYEFEMNIPKGWSAKTDKPPIVLTGVPPSHEIPDPAARKFIDIQARVGSRLPGEKLEEAIQRYLQSNGFEQVSVSPGFVASAESRICAATGYWKENIIRILSLVVLQEKDVVVVQCRALRPLYDNVEAQFRYCLDSFTITTKPIRPVEPEPALRPFDPDLDSFSYIVVEGDTIETIARRFMGNENRAWIIIQNNEIEELKPGMRLKIPRTVPYRIREADDWSGISRNVLGHGKYASWLQEYNQNLEWKIGETIFIPLYTQREAQFREGYVDIAKQVYEDVDKADFLMIYNGNRSMNELDQVKLPIFLFSQFYIYKVQKGDTLAMIAAWLTGDSQKYREIAEANNLSSPYVLSPGQELKIPAVLVPDPTVLTRSRPRPQRPAETPPGKPTPTPRPARPRQIMTPTPSQAPQMGIEGIYEPD